jgi:hypothetical protein
LDADADVEEDREDGADPSSLFKIGSDGNKVRRERMPTFSPGGRRGARAKPTLGFTIAHPKWPT